MSAPEAIPAREPSTADSVAFVMVGMIDAIPLPAIGIGRISKLPVSARHHQALRTQGAEPGLVRLEHGGDPFTRDAWLVVHRDLRRSQPVRAVMDYIVKAVTDAHLFEPAPPRTASAR